MFIGIECLNCNSTLVPTIKTPRQVCTCNNKTFVEIIDKTVIKIGSLDLKMIKTIDNDID